MFLVQRQFYKKCPSVSWANLLLNVFSPAVPLPLFFPFSRVYLRVPLAAPDYCSSLRKETESGQTEIRCVVPEGSIAKFSYRLCSENEFLVYWGIFLLQKTETQLKWKTPCLAPPLGEPQWQDSQEGLQLPPALPGWLPLQAGFPSATQQHPIPSGASKRGARLSNGPSGPQTQSQLVLPGRRGEGDSPAIAPSG